MAEASALLTRELVDLGLAKQAKPEKFDSSDNEFSDDRISRSPIIKPIKRVQLGISYKSHLEDYFKDSFRAKRDLQEKSLPIPEINDLINSQLESRQAYYSQTKELEVNTAKTKALQAVADRMTEGTGYQTRVVVMNRGKNPNAFVELDGTIYISQSLLNCLDTMDEVGAVLSHEINHLLQKTAERQFESDAIWEPPVIGFIHEAVADYQTSELMIKAGYNTRAFESMIQKIASNSRDFEHQTALARAVQMAGKHYVLDSKTSNNPQVPIETILKTKGPIQSTNEELINLLNYQMFQDPDNCNIEPLLANLNKLHGNDLQTLTKLFFGRHLSEKYDPKQVALIERMKQPFIEEMRNRLAASGADPQEIFLFSLSLRHQEAFSAFRDFKPEFIKSPQQLSSLLDRLDTYDSSGRMLNLYCSLFQTYSPPKFPVSPDVYNHFADYLYEMGIGDKIPVDSEVLLKTIGFLSQRLREKAYSRPRLVYFEKVFGINNEYYSQHCGSSASKLQAIFWQHSLKDFLANPDEQKAREYFQKAKDLNIFADAVRTRTLYESINPSEKRFAEIIAEIYGLELKKPEEPEEPTFEELTQQYLVDLFGNKDSDGYMVAMVLNDYLEKAGFNLGYEDQKQLSKDAILERVRKVLQIVDNLELKSSDSPLLFLSGRKGNKDYVPNNELDVKITKLTVKMSILRSFFYHSWGLQFDDTYFNLLNETINKSGINPADLTLMQLVNLSEGMLLSDQGTSGGGGEEYWSLHKALTFQSEMHPGQGGYERLAQISFIQEIQRKLATLEIPDTLDEYLETTKLFVGNIGRISYLSGEDSFGIKRKGNELSRFLFNDSLYSILLGAPFRKKLFEIVDKGVEPKDFGKLYAVIESCLPDSSQRNTYLRILQEQYLKSKDINLNEKLEYLERNFDSIGIQGMLFLGREITTFSDYELFRKRMGRKLQAYLSHPGEAGTKAAGASFVFHYFANNFEIALKTAQENPDVKRELTTGLAEKWSEHTIPSTEYREYYNPELGKFILDTGMREEFKSCQDLIYTLQNLSPSQRYGIALQFLTETEGALASDDNRSKLSELAINAIGLKRGFVEAALETALKEGDRKLIGLLATRMLGPILFRAFDTGFVDYPGILAKQPEVAKKVNEAELKRIITAPTRELIFFGASYFREPNSLIAKMAQEGDTSYRSLLELLDRTIKEPNGQTPESLTASELDPAVESVISAIEGSSPLGVRSLQLAKQLYHFSPAVEKRLSRSLDSNPGLQKLFVWENLYTQMQDDPKLAKFMNERVISINEYLGGGSLFTTLAITIKDAEGQPQPAVIKILNPNALSIIKENYQASQAILSALKDKHGKQYGKEIQTVELLLDFANRWCLADINDPNFQVDDQRFKEVLEEYHGNFNLYAPETEFDSVKVKSERQAPGLTVNKMLEMDGVPLEFKQRVIKELAGFMKYQWDAKTFTDESGQSYHIIHSDPHVGNYIVNLAEMDNPRIGVIDRSMYLRLTSQDISVIKSLVQEKDNRKFFDSLLDRVLDANKVRNPLQRAAIKGKAWIAAGKEYATQKFGSTQESNFRILQQALANLPAGITPPLEMLLIIKNVTAMGELLEKYGMNWEAVS